MNYRKVWLNYLRLKNKIEGVCWSSHTQLREEFCSKDRSQNIKLVRYENLYLSDEVGEKINTLTQLLIDKPSVVTIRVERKLSLKINRSTSGDVAIIRKIFENETIDERHLNDLSIIPEEEFWYLWEKSEAGIERLFMEFRLLTPCVIKDSTSQVAQSTYERIFKKAGLKLIIIPDGIPKYDLLDNPFIFGNKILYTDDSLKYLESLREERILKRISTDGIDKLINLWKQKQ